MADDDLAPIRGSKEFSDLAGACRQREEEAKARARPMLKIIEPSVRSTKDGWPSLMALHGNEQNISVNERCWNSSMQAGHLLALLQSSQIGFSDGFYWNDVEKGVEELKEHWMALIKSRVVDQGRMVIGAFPLGQGWPCSPSSKV